jgi:4-hydroxybenzoyl-CoA thioesterase
VLVNSRNVRIQWGDCDPAGIVFYPRYFAIFDDCTAALFERAAGMTMYQMRKHYAFAGTPLVDARARFIIPSRYDDDVVVESTIREMRRSSFDVQHRLLKSRALSVEGFETRVWVCEEADGGLKGYPIPDEVRARLEGR